ncbi:hypothetical protein [Arthrobacter sp. RIT-PI-e]|uniref:hypothetical protein n=1 Tax=Arthrobacter sp. RIT-PI-e TaxID=1681197 RepID=UPI0006769A50|nr:hypothetical protein [Arthrobacter sp. RIT-PI-e]
MTDGLGPVRGDDGPLSVRGGVGGIRFQWEELEEAAGVLAMLAVDADEIALALGHLRDDVGRLTLHSPLLGPDGGVAGPHHPWALAFLDDARAGALRNAGTLSDAGNRLRAGLRVYRMAGAAAGLAGDGARGRNALLAAFVARAAVGQGALVAGPIAVTSREEGNEVTFDGTVEGMIDRVIALGSDPPGTIEVLRAGTEEAPVHIVVIPGTQSATADGVRGSNPFDVGGIAEAVSEDSRYVAAAVGEAVERSGAAPGDPLILVGYSQGGLHAVNLAGPEALGGSYNVRLVLTAGSPTGWHGAGATEYLHLEHRLDVVPALDGVANQDGRHRTTVTLGNPVPELGERDDGSREPWGLGPAPKLETPGEGARRADARAAPAPPRPRPSARRPG